MKLLLFLINEMDRWSSASTACMFAVKSWLLATFMLLDFYLFSFHSLPTPLNFFFSVWLTEDFWEVCSPYSSEHCELLGALHQKDVSCRL